MNKALIIKQIVAGLGESLAVLQKAAQASRAEATHESSKAENKYDTRGLEASYLAGGQMRQAKEIMDAIHLYESLALKKFAAGDEIDLTALVELENDNVSGYYFIGPKSGGLEVMVGKKEIMVITPQSPLGQNLMGKKAGEKWVAQLGGVKVKYCVVTVE